METKHTKGEWKYSVKYRGSTKNSLIQVQIPSNTILTIGEIDDESCTVPTCCKVEEHANAKLIAAAPELLNVIIEFLEDESVNNLYGENYHTIINMKNAIKKATE